MQRPLFALGLRVGSALAFSTMFMLVKYAGERGVKLPEIMFWRQAVSVPLILLTLWFGRRIHLLETRRLGTHARRALLGMTNMILVFGSTILLPLSVSATLGFTAPLFAVLIAALVLRERVGVWRWTAVALGFAGVLVILRPGGEPIPPLGAGMGLVAAVLVAVVNFQVRDLGRTEAPVASVFYFSAFGTALAAPALPFFLTPHDLLEWLVLLGIGLSGTCGQLLLAGSLKHGQVASVMVMDYVSLLGATFYTWLLWNAFPPPAIWFGAPLIVAAGVVIAWREHQLGKQGAQSADARRELTS